MKHDKGLINTNDELLSRDCSLPLFETLQNAVDDSGLEAQRLERKQNEEQTCEGGFPRFGRFDGG